MHRSASPWRFHRPDYSRALKGDADNWVREPSFGALNTVYERGTNGRKDRGTGTGLAELGTLGGDRTAVRCRGRRSAARFDRDPAHARGARGRTALGAPPYGRLRPGPRSPHREPGDPAGTCRTPC